MGGALVELIDKIVAGLPWFAAGTVLCVIIGLLFRRKKIPPPEDEKPIRDAVTLVKFLLVETAGLSREDRARKFIQAGVTFMKGPFRCSSFFAKEGEFEMLPTNEELHAAETAAK